MGIGDLLVVGALGVGVYYYLTKKTSANTGVIDVYGETEDDIQNAIDSTGSGRIIKAHGNYDISSSILVPSDTTLMIDGVLKASNSITGPIIKNSDYDNGNKNIIITGGEIDGNNVSVTGCTQGDNKCTSILMEAVSGKRNENIKVQGTYLHNGKVRAIQYTNCFNSLIDKCTFKNYGWVALDVMLVNGNNSWVQCGNTISNNYFDNNISAITPGWAKGLKVLNNTIKNCSHFDIFCDGDQETLIKDNIIYKKIGIDKPAIGANCAAGAPSYGLDIQNNYIYDANIGVEILCGTYGGHKVRYNHFSNTTTPIKISRGNLNNGTIIENNTPNDITYVD